MSRHLKLIAAVAVVLVAISGFSPNRKGGGRSSSSKGGGCSSSSSSSHNSSSSSSGGSYNNSTSGSSGSSNGSSSNGGSSHSSSPNGVVKRCAAEYGKDAKAVVQVRNSSGRSRTLTVEVDFRDTAGTLVDSGTARVGVGSKKTRAVDVYMDDPQLVDEVERCQVTSVR